MKQTFLTRLILALSIASVTALSNASTPILKLVSNIRPSVVSTVPPNGDENPYGVAYVPTGFPSGGLLNPGDVLVSNFNNSANLQGEGGTIVRITQAGTRSVFYQGRGLGLTTALGVLRTGFVVVGNVPTQDGTINTIGQGSLIILDKLGRLVSTLRSAIFLDGPWDLAIHEVGPFAQVYVSNVLSGTVSRIDLLLDKGFSVLDMAEIASGYDREPNAAALILGPTGLAYDANQDLLYVASTADNAVYAIPNASWTGADTKGVLVYEDPAHLRGPLALILAPGGDLIAANGDAVNANAMQPSEMVEFTPNGQFVAQYSVDKTGEGGAFGLAFMRTPTGLQLAAVDDVTNTLKLWNVNLNPRPGP